jgi:peptidoglycan/xylan/chitin deacetylase (PgdA/CDA1 family)
VVAVIVAIVLSTTGGSKSHPNRAASPGADKSGGRSSTTSPATRRPGTASVPILTYHVINAAPSQTGASPDLYVPPDEFAAQMNALKSAGWRAVTLDQVQAYWTRGVPLAAGKPIVISFDRGYASHYTNALPVLKRLGWVGVENLQPDGLSVTDGGLTDAQVRGLISAGWELDVEGNSQPDLTGLSSTGAAQEVTTQRQTLKSRYSVPANWYSYFSGQYNPTVTAAVRAAGFVGATTTATGWASPQADRFLLPRLQVAGGTNPTDLLAQIAAAQSTTSVPTASPGT